MNYLSYHPPAKAGGNSAGGNSNLGDNSYHQFKNRGNLSILIINYFSKIYWRHRIK